MGLRYKLYCLQIVRIFMVDFNKFQESNYKFLFFVYNMILKGIWDGVVVKDVYFKVFGLIKLKKFEFEKYFLKNVGYGIGFENKDFILVFNVKN